jgi:hypothetical protein
VRLARDERRHHRIVHSAMSLYGPITDPLNAAFGDGAFEFRHTGGGCTAIQSMLDGELTVVITDGTTSLHGEEACITDVPTRLANGGDTAYGYCVGVYGDEDCTLLAMDDLPTVAASELPGVVTRLIDEARKQL